MTDEERTVEGLKRIESMNRKRGHATCKIKENLDDPPNVFAEMDGKPIGVEVTELVDKKSIDKHPKTPPAWGISRTGPACTR